MKLNKKVLIAPLLIIWGIVLYAQFGPDGSADAAAVSPATPQGAAQTDDTTPTTTEPDQPTQKDGLASTEVLAAQEQSIRGLQTDLLRNPFAPSGTAGSGSGELMVTAIIGRYAVINGQRYKVGDTLQDGSTLVELGRGWVKVDRRGTPTKLNITRRPRNNR